jgi:hypothetical protein
MTGAPVRGDEADRGRGACRGLPSVSPNGSYGTERPRRALLIVGLPSSPAILTPLVAARGLRRDLSGNRGDSGSCSN